MQEVITAELWLVAKCDMLHPQVCLSREWAEAIANHHGGRVIKARIPISLLGCFETEYSTGSNRPIVHLSPDDEHELPTPVDEPYEPENANLDMLDTSISAFLKHCCRLTPHGKVRNQQLRESYIRFCNQYGHYPVPHKTLTQQLETLEVFSRCTSSYRYKIGLELIPTAA